MTAVDAAALAALRRDAVEWHRRGMRSPAELEALVAGRLARQGASLTEPRYGDFFRED